MTRPTISDQRSLIEWIGSDPGRCGAGKRHEVDGIGYFRTSMQVKSTDCRDLCALIARFGAFAALASRGFLLELE